MELLPIFLFFGALLSGIGKRFLIGGSFALGFSAFNRMVVPLAVLYVGYVFFLFYKDGKSRIKYIYIFVDLVILLLAGVLLLVEAWHYPNYTYTIWGVKEFDSTALFDVGLLGTLIWLISFFGLKKQVKKLRIFFTFHSLPLIVLGILCIGTFLNLPNQVLIKQPFYKDVIGPQYKYIEAMEDGISNSCPIIHPPKLKFWPSVGNQYIIRYFLFPKTLLSGSLIGKIYKNLDYGEYCFVKINDTEETEWPIIDLQKSMINFDLKDGNDWIKYTDLVQIAVSNNGVLVYKVKLSK